MSVSSVPHSKTRELTELGSWTAQFVSEAMHSTHKTILIEKNSHFQVGDHLA
jgi:hypothetical protein